MTDQHPITPPLKLISKWAQYQDLQKPEALWQTIATKAARWGADQELEACAEHLKRDLYFPDSTIELLRAARRPKPPSLKEQALRILVENGTTLDGRIELEPEDIPIIRRALEALPND